MTATATTTAPEAEHTGSWVDVCAAADITPGRGVAALIGGLQMAVFVLDDGRVFAIDNRDPWSGANIMSRGLVGSIGERVVVASPMYKQRVDLATGEGIDDPDARVSTYPTRVAAGRVEVAFP